MKLTELFNSFQGEGMYTGYPMTFIRIAGCPVACPFCDTDYTYGESRSMKGILAQVEHSHVCLTGGEPLVHPEIVPLIYKLTDHPKVEMIHIETSGCYPLPPIVFRHPDSFWVTVSPKGKFLGAKKDFLPEVIDQADEVKWIVPGTPVELIEEYRNACPNTYIQPVNSKLAIDRDSLLLAQNLAAKLNLPLSMQVHKLLNWR